MLQIITSAQDKSSSTVYGMPKSKGARRAQCCEWKCAAASNNDYCKQ